MVDYLQVILNGTFTGIGAIIAHELYDAFREYRKRIKESLLNNK
jgi:hypothetical protein